MPAARLLEALVDEAPNAVKENVDPDEAEQIQRLFMEGKRDEGIAVVPDQFADEISLCGPRDRVREKLVDWKNSPVTSLLVNGDAQLLRDMAELVL